MLTYIKEIKFLDKGGFWRSTKLRQSLVGEFENNFFNSVCRYEVHLEFGISSHSFVNKECSILTPTHSFENFTVDLEYRMLYKLRLKIAGSSCSQLTLRLIVVLSISECLKNVQKLG